MWFKNLFVYQLGSWEDSKDSLAEKLRSQALTSCGSADLQTIGWAPPIPGQDHLVYAKGDQFLLCLAKEKKLLPSSVVQQFTKARALEIEEQEGFKPGRKRMKELKEEMLHMLLPRAFTIRSQTLVWVDLRSKTLCIDAGSPNKAEEVLTILLKSLGGLDIQPLKTSVQPSVGMTQWVADQDTPPRFFSVDAEYELKSQESEGSNIRYVNHVLESDDFNKLVSQGKRVARLALTWSDKISFTLHETLQIKRIRPLDVLQEQMDAEDEQERFDAEFLLMTGELSLLLQHLTDALGGTNTAQTHEQRRSA